MAATEHSHNLQASFVAAGGQWVWHGTVIVLNLHNNTRYIRFYNGEVSASSASEAMALGEADLRKQAFFDGIIQSPPVISVEMKRDNQL